MPDRPQNSPQVRLADIGTDPDHGTAERNLDNWRRPRCRRFRQRLARCRRDQGSFGQRLPPPAEQLRWRNLHLTVSVIPAPPTILLEDRRKFGALRAPTHVDFRA